jgi:hypothetical protein
VAYDKLVWLTTNASDCQVEIESADSGLSGRVQNDGSNNVVLDQTIWEEVAALETAWVSYTPTISASSGTITTSSGSGRYKQIGKTVYFQATATITTNGTGAGNLIITLPIAAQAANRFFGSGRDSTSGALCVWYNSSTTQAYVQTTAGVYPGADGRSISISGSYETS